MNEFWPCDHKTFDYESHTGTSKSSNHVYAHNELMFPAFDSSVYWCIYMLPYCLHKSFHQYHYTNPECTDASCWSDTSVLNERVLTLWSQNIRLWVSYWYFKIVQPEWCIYLSRTLKRPMTAYNTYMLTMNWCFQHSILQYTDVYTCSHIVSINRSTNTITRTSSWDTRCLNVLII
jgi:hypothetical protein